MILKKNKAIFRADGSAITAYGHVMRLLSLAGILKKKYHLEFVIQQPDDFLKKQITAVCDNITEIPITTNFVKEATQLSKTIDDNDICIMDGYNFDTQYQAILKNKCFKLICIDDLHDRHFVADAVINHSEGIDRKKYSAAYYTKVFLGAHYAILRKTFLNNLPSASSLPAQKLRMFINMGGTDQLNYTCKAVNDCLQNKTISHMDVVIGSFFSHRQQLQELVNKHPTISINIHSNLPEKKIGALMKKSHAAICSASTVAYEYVSVGGPLFIYKTVDNQKNIYSFLLKSGIAFKANQLNDKLKELRQFRASNAYFKNRTIYFNGQSDKNLLTIFEKFEKEREVIIRKAQLSDLKVYYRWVNEKEVRKNSFNQANIPLAGHTRWFQGKLQNKATTLYYFEKGGIPLGQVRFDKEKDMAEIDFSIDPKFRGKGFGEIILLKAISAYSRANPQTLIVGKVKDDNVPSNQVFIKIGFKMRKTIGNTGYRTFTLLPVT